MSRTRRVVARGNVGRGRGETMIPEAIGQCIEAIRRLPLTARVRVLDGLRAYVMEDAFPPPWDDDSPP